MRLTILLNSKILILTLGFLMLGFALPVRAQDAPERKLYNSGASENGGSKPLFLGVPGKRNTSSGAVAPSARAGNNASGASAGLLAQDEMMRAVDRQNKANAQASTARFNQLAQDLAAANHARIAQKRMMEAQAAGLPPAAVAGTGAPTGTVPQAAPPAAAPMVYDKEKQDARKKKSLFNFRE